MKKVEAYLLLLGIIILLAVISNPGPHRSRDARKKHAFADINGGLKTVLQMFKEDCGRYPTTAEGFKILVNPSPDGSLTNWRGPYIDPTIALKDPWGHEYIYRFPGVHNTNGYDLYSKGPNGVENDADDIGNWQMPEIPAKASVR